MTNKPMLSVELELLELVTDNKHIDKESICIRRWEALCKLRAILNKPAGQHQGEPVAWRYHDEYGVSRWFDGAPDQISIDFVASRGGCIELSFSKAVEQPAPVALTVWYGSMPESNGKTNWTAILHRKGDGEFPLRDIAGGITIDRSEYPDRVRYEADRMRYLIGELTEEPDILDYDDKLHSGYVNPHKPAPVAVVMPEQLIAAIEAEQERLFREDYMMDSDDCVNVIREELARLNGVKP